VVKGGDKIYPSIPCDFQGHGPTLCFWFWSMKGLGFGQLASVEVSSLEALWSYADARICSRAKTGLVLRNFKILFVVLFSVIPGAQLAGICSITSWMSMLESDGRGQRLVPSLVRFVYCVLSKVNVLVCKSC
jgi:hypothetical protein